MTSVEDRYRILDRADLAETDLSSIVHAEIVERLGQNISSLLNGIQAAFPLATQIMEGHWAAPCLVTADVRGYTAAWLLADSLNDGQALLFDLNSAAKPILGPRFDQDHWMLPDGWRELYRFVDSFGFYAMNSSLTMARLPFLTPPPFASRKDPVGYVNAVRRPFVRMHNHASLSQIHDFAVRIGAMDFGGSSPAESGPATGFGMLRCWLVTDALDSLWIDESQVSGQVHWVRRGCFDDHACLQNPTQALDAYLAHVLLGISADRFDFEPFV